MKYIYFLPILSINLFAHVDNTIHIHLIESIIYLVIFFAFTILGVTIVQFLRAVCRRLTWKLKM